jgi:hypothetical protein
MEDANFSGAEEYISAEIEAAKEICPTEEKAIREAVTNSKAIRGDSLGIEGRKVTLYYDPTRMTKDELTKLIVQAGAKPSDVQTERAPL